MANPRPPTPPLMRARKRRFSYWHLTTRLVGYQDARRFRHTKCSETNISNTAFVIYVAYYQSSSSFQQFKAIIPVAATVKSSDGFFRIHRMFFSTLVCQIPDIHTCHSAHLHKYIKSSCSASRLSLSLPSIISDASAIHNLFKNNHQ